MRFVSAIVLELQQKLFQKILRHPEAVCGRRAHVVNGSNFLRQHLFRGGESAGTYLLRSQDRFGPHAPEDNRRDAAQRDADVANRVVLHLRQAGKAYFGDCLRFSLAHLAVILSPVLLRAGGSNTTDDLLGSKAYWFVAGMD